MKKSKKLMILGLSAATAAVAATGAVSSFAWFAINDSVTATGMKVKVQSASTLLISTKNTATTNGRLDEGASTKATTATAPTEGIKPTSTVDGTNWFAADGKEADAYTAKDNSYAAIDSEDLANYRLENTFYLQAYDNTKAKSATYASTGKKLVLDYITIDFTSGDNLAPCFRVLTVIGGTKVFCAPTVTGKKTGNGVKSVTSGAATTEALTFAAVSYNNPTATLTSGNELISAVNYNEIYEAKIYLYFDGEDSTCTTNNIPADIKDYTVSVAFTLE